jgi:DNA polymerase-3 subunit gamma/tau
MRGTAGSDATASGEVPTLPSGTGNASASAERPLAAEQLIHATPLVQNLMRDFGAKVVPGSIRPL